MKKLLIFLLFIFSTSLLLAQELSPEDILFRHLKAIGQDKLDGLETIKISGRIIMPQQGLEMQATVYQKKPEKVRQEMEVQGMKVLMVIDGETGWVVNPMMGTSDPQDLDEASLEALINEGRNDPSGSWDNPLQTYKEDGTKIELFGREELNGSQAYNLKFTYKDNNTVFYIIDAAAYLLLKTKTNQNVQGQTFDREVRYSDYKDFDGIMLPGKIEVLVNGQVGQVFTMDICEFNPPIDDSIFRKPVKE